MKHYISAVLAATFIAGLTACGGGAQEASPSTASASATPTRTARAIPDLARKSFTDAQDTLRGDGFVVSIVGKNGTEWTGGVDDTVKVVSTVPAAGEVTNATDIAVTVNITQDEFLAASEARATAEKAAADAAAKAAAAPKVTGLAATLPKQFPGYPLIVHGSSLDYRVASWFEGKLVDDQVVALIPGVYTPYNPKVTDLLAYYEDGGDGDSIMRKQYMPEAGGAGWSGVLPGPEEPK
ncbi:PASTA domain-containing protein [Arthrobacter sp. ISL-5]|uniref:PASTA domain-containing protein n=1 Tax=Arthrobacter sp. ISL-5 TaxID=2819111 RepID=UPI001BEB9D41|nr:PASTA domain-containing protein [Arthrobacter sp. ISL-5]MBT2555620.1 PASTA domain-containing protein [Arthrobacter sp. ISL-5]